MSSGQHMTIEQRAMTGRTHVEEGRACTCGAALPYRAQGQGRQREVCDSCLYQRSLGYARARARRRWERLRAEGAPEACRARQDGSTS